MRQTLLPALLLLPNLAFAETFTGKVIGVSDGDTITVLRDKKPVKIRLHGVDCPEMKQPYGKKAKQFTSKMVFGKVVKVEVVTKDRYGRTVGKVCVERWITTSGGREQRTKIRKLKIEECAGEELVRTGLAWWYRKYAPKDATLAKLEREAKKAKRGLWADKNLPWDWRRGKRPIKCPPWTTSGLLKKHVPGAWIGKRSTVIDGDTLLILRTRDGARVRIHLYGVDAPELDQPYGKAAKRFVAKSKTAVLHVKPMETDAEGRVFAVVSWTNGSLNGWLVKYGFGWFNKRQGCFPSLAAVEAKARNRKRGLWADENPVAPWDWRRGKRTTKGRDEQVIRDLRSLCDYLTKRIKDPPCPKTELCVLFSPDFMKRLCCGKVWQLGKHLGSTADPDIHAEYRLLAKENGYPNWSCPAMDVAFPRAKYRCNTKSKVCHRPNCKHYRCKHCTATFASEAEAKKAGYRVHKTR